MTDNDLFYVCALIETIGRITLNRRGAIVKALGIPGIEKQLRDAPVNHCLQFEQVSDEVIQQYAIENGSFDPIAKCKYTVPTPQDIGKLYAMLVESLRDDDSTAERIYKLFSSFLSDEISHFSTDLYYQNPSYLLACYEEGKIL